MSKEPELKDKSHKPPLKNSAGDNPYLFDCPWCGALKGCLCKNENNKEYTDGTYHRARLMIDCLEQANKDAHNSSKPLKLLPEVNYSPTTLRLSRGHLSQTITYQR